MEPRRTPEYVLEVFADPTCVKDIVKGTFSFAALRRPCCPGAPRRPKLTR